MGAPLTVIEQPGYRSLADSPFELDPAFSGFEDFEDGLVNGRGLTVSTGVHEVPTGVHGGGVSVFVRSHDSNPVAHAVEANGRTVSPVRQDFNFVNPSTVWSGLWFEFDPFALGSLPDSFGFVWSHADAMSNRIWIRVYGAGGEQLGEWERIVTPGDAGLFIGVSTPGIAAVNVSSWTRSEPSWFELDHVQYGVAVPEPATLALLGIGVLLLYRIRRAGSAYNS